MKRLLFSPLLALLLGAGLAGCDADFDAAELDSDVDIEPDVADFEPPSADFEPPSADFEPPVRLMAGDAAIRVESPGWAAPAWVDLNGDGRMNLLVGQFSRGKIRVFEHLDAEKFAPGNWLQAEGNVAEVPGVW
jgi:hypothetical protein